MNSSAVHHLHLVHHHLCSLRVCHADLIDHHCHLLRVHHLLLHGLHLLWAHPLWHTSLRYHRSLRLLHAWVLLVLKLHTRSHSEHLVCHLWILAWHHPSLHHLSWITHLALHLRHLLELVKVISYHVWSHLRSHTCHPWMHLLLRIKWHAHTWSADHSTQRIWHSSRSSFIDAWNDRSRLSGLSAHIIIVLFDIVLYLVELSICQLHRCRLINERNFVNEILAHELVSVLDEYVSRNFFLYIETTIVINNVVILIN